MSADESLALTAVLVPCSLASHLTGESATWQVLREGTKKTVFVNFTELCKVMHRQPDHVMGYLNAELGTSGSLDGQLRLIMKGRFTPKVSTLQPLLPALSHCCHLLRVHHLAQLRHTPGGLEKREERTSTWLLTGAGSQVFEGILRRYVNEYVICNMCKSTDTLLSREQRLFMLRCQSCGASRSVTAVKTGFMAQIGRRKKT